MGLYTNNHGPRPAKKASRTLPTAPERVLDAPDLVDDYYLNLLDWGSNNSVSHSIPKPSGNFMLLCKYKTLKDQAQDT